MDPLSAILAFVGIASTLFSIAKGVDDMQETSNTNNKSIKLAEDNLQLNKETAEKNFELSQEQFDYQKKLNELVMQREDTAIQRQVADLKAAGLSPLMVSGGASATPLTSANAPQMDMTGINQALGNAIGAYNDAFNRKLQSKNFALQAKSQTAQIYTQLAESYRDTKKAQLEYEYLDEKLKWEKDHGFRDLNWKSELTQVIEQILKGKTPTQLQGEPGKTAKDKLIDFLNGPEQDYKGNPLPIQPKDMDPITALDLEYQTEANTERLHKQQNKDYKWSMNIIETHSPNNYGTDKKVTQAIDYIYRHTNAHNDYSTVFLFKKALAADRKIAKKYSLTVNE